MRFKGWMLGCVALLAALPLVSAPVHAATKTTITVIGLSDYHSHAVPFYSEGATDQGGVARTIAYLTAQRTEQYDKTKHQH